MKKVFVFGAAVILLAVSSPSMSQAAGCAQYDPGCATYPMPKKDGAVTNRSVRAEVGTRATGPTARLEQRTTAMDRNYAVINAGGPVRAAGAVAAGTVTAASAIATAPFRAANSYAYYNGSSAGWD